MGIVAKKGDDGKPAGFLIEGAKDVLLVKDSHVPALTAPVINLNIAPVFNQQAVPP
jgi:hypothetical protein